MDTDMLRLQEDDGTIIEMVFVINIRFCDLLNGISRHQKLP
jgi:hypothetical protein